MGGTPPLFTALSCPPALSAAQKDGDRFWKLPECYVRGNTIKFLRVPDEVGLWDQGAGLGGHRVWPVRGLAGQGVGRPEGV